jgi:hypothetical protein
LTPGGSQPFKEKLEFRLIGLGAGFDSILGMPAYRMTDCVEGLIPCRTPVRPDGSLSLGLIITRRRRRRREIVLHYLWNISAQKGASEKTRTALSFVKLRINNSFTLRLGEFSAAV